MSEKPLDLFAGHDPTTEPELPGNYLTSTLAAGRRRAARHRALRTAAGTGLAAVAAVAMVATLGPTTAHGPAGSDNRGTAVAQDRGLNFEAPVDAAALLRNAALVANEQSLAPRNDQFIHSKYVVANTKYGAPGQMLHSESWISADGSKVGWSTGDSGTGGQESYALQAIGQGGLDSPTYAYLATLPTDPDALLAMVRKSVTGKAAKLGDKVQDPDQMAFEALGGLIHQSSVLPPKLGAAVYRAAAKIPGVTLVPNATDAAGRKGLGVARTQKATSIQAEWIFEPGKFGYLGQTRLDTKTREVTSNIAILDVEVVDALPAGADTSKSLSGPAGPSPVDSTKNGDRAARDRQQPPAVHG